MNPDEFIIELFKINQVTKAGNIYTRECVTNLKQQLKENKCTPFKIYKENRIETFIGDIEGEIVDVFEKDNVCYAKIKALNFVIGLDSEGEISETINKKDKRCFTVDRITKFHGVNLIRKG